MEGCVPLQGLGYKIFLCMIISPSIYWPASENLAQNFKGPEDEVVLKWKESGSPNLWEDSPVNTQVDYDRSYVEVQCSTTENCLGKQQDILANISCLNPLLYGLVLCSVVYRRRNGQFCLKQWKALSMSGTLKNHKKRSSPMCIRVVLLKSDLVFLL